MRLASLALLLTLAAPAAAQDSPAVVAAADALARLVALESRVAALEQQRNAPESGKRTYADAYAVALATGKPLVCWSGSAICAACVHDTDGTEWVNFVGEAPGCPPNQITVSVPENGELVTVAEIRSWMRGDAQFGHVPSTRRALANWRANRTRLLVPATGMYSQATMMSGTGACASCGAAGMMMGQPIMGGGMMMMAGGGGCASCNSGTGGGGCASCNSGSRFRR